jgi:AraC family transcriptional regulator
MDYLKRMNEALNYIEENLIGEIEYTKAASLACVSVSYFQRVFSFIAEIPLSEYIRRRRMTLAAFELQNTDLKVIDIAMKYGYESPDSFTRAFHNIHGITPSVARNEGVTLKAYPRITFHISIKGEIEMNYKIVKKEEFRIVGIKKHYEGQNDDESVVPVFWNEIYKNGVFDKLMKLSTCEPKGVHGFLNVLGEEKVDYTIGCVSDKETPEGMTSDIVPASTWAIFEVNGPVSIAMADVWKRIFTEWLPTSNYKHAETTEIECFQYPGDKRADDFKFEIWIPVVIKDER